MNRMKFCFLLMSVASAPAIQAHFYAYQEWYNPVTGQILEEFSDFHTTKNPAINCLQQQKELLERAKKMGNILVIAEDNFSYVYSCTPEILQKDPTLSVYATGLDPKDILLKEALRPMPAVQRSPLRGLGTFCLVNHIAFFNSECRSPNKNPEIFGHHPYVPEAYQKEIDSYDDGPVFNSFYKAIKANIEILAKTFTRSKPESLYGLLAIDCRILHTIGSCTDKHIILAAGGAHIRSVNNVLLSAGWQQQSCVLPITLSSTERFILESNYLKPTPQPIASCYSMKLDFSPERKLECAALARGNFRDKHAITVDTISFNPKMCFAPGTSLDDDKKQAACDVESKKDASDKKESLLTEGESAEHRPSVVSTKRESESGVETESTGHDKKRLKHIDTRS